MTTTRSKSPTPSKKTKRAKQSTKIPFFQVNASFLANTNGSQQKHLTVNITKGSVHTVLICRLSIESITQNQEKLQNPLRNVPHVRFICVRIILLIIITKIFD